MLNFWEFNAWGTILLFAFIFGGLIAGNIIKKTVPFMNKSLIPTSVIGGILLLIVAEIYKLIFKQELFNTVAFGGDGGDMLEVITYHCLALGFIASTLKVSEKKITKERTAEILNTGLTTVATYLVQAVLGLAVTVIAAGIIPGFLAGAGALLPFGYGQGTGQAMNYGSIYEYDFGFSGGTSFGLAVAAMGFLSAAIGGVIHLNVSRKRGRLDTVAMKNRKLTSDDIEGENEIPMQESMDKVTIQIALIFITYLMTFLLMWLLGKLVPGSRSIVYGFNFLVGVLMAVLLKAIINFFMKKGVINKEYRNNFLLTRCSNFFFDIMVCAGIAAISIDKIKNYVGILLILGVVGLVATYIYTRFVTSKLFPKYHQEQFMVMYGMLTGTASTGIILLREIDPDFETPASENLVYQNIPAIVFGFPMMLFGTIAPTHPVLTMVTAFVYFCGINILLFRKQIFRQRKKVSGQFESEREADE